MIELFELIIERGKRKTAKDILVFLKLIDKAHLEKHLINKVDISSGYFRISDGITMNTNHYGIIIKTE